MIDLSLRSPQWLTVAAFAALLVAHSAFAMDNAAAAAPMPIGSVDGSAVAGAMVGMPDSLAGFGAPSGTEVGQRAVELRDDVLKLRSAINNDASEFMQLRSSGVAGAVQYHSTVAAITARLQNGTTRGNPILLRQWGEAQTALNEVNNSLTRLNDLSTRISANSSLAAYLLESIQAAYHLSGAVDEDHDQLSLIRDEVSRLIVQVDYMRNQITDDVTRQTAYLTTERSNLQALSFAINRGELLAGGLGSRSVMVEASPVMALPAQPMMQSPIAAMPQMMASPSQPVTARPLTQYAKEQPVTTLPTSNPDVAMAPSAGKLLVMIRFNKPFVNYEQQLAQAVSSTLERRPNAEFTVVAVAPSRGDSSEIATSSESAQRNAENVKRALMQMGLASTRIATANTSAASARSAEVHVYVR